MPMDLPFISVVIPVKNAERYINQCLQSLKKLDYPADKYEIIISDSSSNDTTRQIAASLGACVIDAGGESVCAGRNSGLKEAKGELIAFSDADCVMDREWLKNSVKYFEDEKVCCVGGPSLIPEDETVFGKACGFIFSFSLFTGGSPYGRYFDRVRQVSHNAGCNAIYRRSALEKVFPIEESFTDGEDVITNKRLKDLGYRFLFTPDTKLWHYRSSYSKRFWRQNYRYGIGRVLIGRAYKELLNPMHIISGFSIPLIVLVLAVAAWAGLNFLSGVVSAAILVLAFFFLLAWIRTQSFAVALRVPMAIIYLLIPWSLGFMKETFFPSILNISRTSNRKEVGETLNIKH
ncbi:MAG: glycosyltransferase [Candidatus Omnitrophica bacterium]|nr:glycosyltransferase [Candidatus Omnitrophota bacterium]